MGHERHSSATSFLDPILSQRFSSKIRKIEKIVSEMITPKGFQRCVLFRYESLPYSLGGENLFLFRSTPVRERAAFTFAGDVLSKGFQTEWALGMGYLPINS